MGKHQLRLHIITLFLGDRHGCLKEHRILCTSSVRQLARLDETASRAQSRVSDVSLIAEGRKNEPQNQLTTSSCYQLSLQKVDGQPFPQELIALIPLRLSISVSLMKAWSALAWLAIQQQQKRSPIFARAFLSSSTSTLSTRLARRNVLQYPSVLSITRCNMSASADTTDIDDIDVAEHLRLVRESIQTAKSPYPERPIRLVAVSKTKPIELLLKAYEEGGCRIFGENYAQELVEKVPQMANDVQWHFIGGLQSNKANMLVNAFDDVSRLVVETVDKIKLANKLNNAAAGKEGKLKIFVQVNTSGEESKSGCEPSEVLELCEQIIKDCENLELMGLMTIGAPGDLSCFDALAECRSTVEEKLGVELELSMGMSGDYIQAIERGATNVRVGSTIFGARNYANKT